MTFELSKETQQKWKNIGFGVVILGLVALVVAFLVAIYKPKDSDDGESPQMMMNSTQPQRSPYKYIPLLDREGNMVTGTFQDLLDKMAEEEEPVVFPSNVTFSQGATVQGDVNFENPVEFNNGMTVHGKTTIHGTHVVEGLSMAHDIRTNSVASHGPNLKLKGKAITLLSGHQNLNEPIEGRNIMLQTITDDRQDNDGYWDRVFIPKKTGIGHLNTHDVDSIQVGQGNWGDVANGNRITLNENGIVTGGKTAKYFWVNGYNNYGDIDD